MTNTQKTIDERFDERFTNKEGCQSFGAQCGQKINGVFVCSFCKKWGGIILQQYMLFIMAK